MITRRRFILAGVALALLPHASTAAPRLRIGPPVDHRLRRGALCILTPGPPLWHGRVLPGDIVEFVRAPIPGCSGAVFLYAPPWVYEYSHSDNRHVGADNQHCAAVLDRRRLRVLHLAQPFGLKFEARDGGAEGGIVRRWQLGCDPFKDAVEQLGI